MITSANDFPSIFAVLVTHAQELGIFEVVYQGEPKMAPTNGLTIALYVGGTGDQGFSVVARRSGLATVAKRIVITARIHLPMLHEPTSEIESTILGAAEQYIDSLIGDYMLGSTVDFLDIFGAYGAAVSGLPGYITIDSKIFRVMSITIPVVLESEVTENG
jgi:hypothetical protein